MFDEYLILNPIKPKTPVAANIIDTRTQNQSSQINSFSNKLDGLRKLSMKPEIT